MQLLRISIDDDGPRREVDVEPHALGDRTTFDEIGCASRTVFTEIVTDTLQHGRPGKIQELPESCLPSADFVQN